MPASGSYSLSESTKCIVLVCRDPGRRAMLERIVPAAEAHSSAIEAMLAVARKNPRAVIVNFQDVEGSQRDVVAAMRRAHPEVPVYFVVEPEDEPAARRLVQAGAGDYFVLPTDVYRLPRVLDPSFDPEALDGPPARPASPAAPVAGQELPATALPAAPPRERPEQLRLFVSACALSDLAQADARTILREGAAIIFHALAAARGCLLSCDSRTESLLLVTAIGEAPGAGADTFEAERAAAGQALRANDAILTEAGAPPRPLLCVPVRGDEETFAVLCISGKHDGTALDSDDRDIATRLVGIMAGLYSAAARLERFATMALRDAETGLLKADALEKYLTKLIGRAAAQNAPVTIILLRPDTSGGPADATAVARLGRAIAARLPQGWQGARIGGDRFVVVGAPKPDAQPLPQEVALLYAARSRGIVDLGGSGAKRLSTAVAEFPKDGSDARTLLATAAGRLTAS
jgi:GGDEF domain-containing protein